MGKQSRWVIVIVGAAGLVLLGAMAGSGQIGYQAVPRDAFPVFDNPQMLTAKEAEERDIVFDRDMVIGIARGREAKAYPITIMGVHELGNDTIDGTPIAVSW